MEFELTTLGVYFIITQSQSATVYFFCTISSFFSVNISLTYISDMTWPILTRLGHKYWLTTPFMSHDQIGVRGHAGVTGVKKAIFTKNATPTDYVGRSRDLCML